MNKGKFLDYIDDKGFDELYDLIDTLPIEGLVPILFGKIHPKNKTEELEVAAFLCRISFELIKANQEKIKRGYINEYSRFFNRDRWKRKLEKTTSKK